MTMSFERFSSSDVYIFEHVGGFIECCGCLFRDSLPYDDSDGFPQLATPREALEHLDYHEKAGHDIGKARNRIIETYPDLDVEIEPYETSPEVRERVRAKLRELNTQMSDGQDWTKPVKVTAKEWQKLEDPRFNDPLYVSGYSDGITDEQERILKELQDEYDYLFETYGSTIIKDELDLLLKIMEKITGIGHLKKRLGEEVSDKITLKTESIDKLTEHWIAEGKHIERERVKKILDRSRDCDCSNTCRTDVNIYAFVLEELGIDLFKLIDGDQE